MKEALLLGLSALFEYFHLEMHGGQAASTADTFHLLQISNLGAFLDGRLPGQADIRPT